MSTPLLNFFVQLVASFDLKLAPSIFVKKFALFVYMLFFSFVFEKFGTF